jgi:ascorbate PTS system EIIA or EIIAB component
MSLSTWLPEGAIRIRAEASDWREAVRLSGEALTEAGAADPAYTDEMIRTIEELGPYIVIAPGFALAHSRPSPAVRRAGLSWITLREPVSFGSAKNDPVDVVVGLAALDHEGHLEMMSELARVVSDPERLAALRAARSEDEARGVLDDAGA